MSGCYNCAYGDVCESAQENCPNYEPETEDLSYLGFEPDYPKKDSTQESAN